jgi:serine kinase of HPr protein (carbohydrate metabolism regulator)
VFDLKLPRLKAGEIDKLNHLNWVTGFSFLAYGVRIGVRTNDMQLIEKLLLHLPPGWKISNASVDRLYSLFVRSRGNRRTKRPHELYADAEKLGSNTKLDDLLDFFESDLQLYVAEYAPQRIFVHAGVVAWKGKAIIIPGRSYSGKTTLVAALVKAGATYYSDEYAVLDKSGLVHSYPRKLGIRQGSKIVKTRKYAAEEIGAKTGSKPLPVGLVLVSQYKERARFRPQEISAGEAILALLNNTVSARRQPEMALATLNKAISRARLIKSRRGEATEIIDRVLKICEQQVADFVLTPQG